MINAFLSYRHKNPLAIQVRDSLNELCEASGKVALVYDEDNTDYGDSLIHFMEDLVDARCVFIFLDPDYFHSAYTLFELICISEQAGFDRRFVHPVRLSEDMVTYTRTNAKTFWRDDGNEAIRVELGRLLEKTNRLNSYKNDDFDAIWKRVESAWSRLVEDHLDELHPSVSLENRGQMLQVRLDMVLSAVETVKQELHENLVNHVGEQIKVILERKHISLTLLASKFKDPRNILVSSSDEIAAYITREGNDLESTISSFVQAIQQQKVMLRYKDDQWEDCFYDAQQVIGWLLLLSVDSEWWFENQNILEKNANNQVLNEFYLEDRRYIEVVISRGLLVQAGFKLDEFGEAEPNTRQNNIVMLYDATSEGAEDLQFLSVIYKDLFPASSRLPPAENGKLQADVLLNKIQRRAKVYKQNADGKAIYYLISSEAKESIIKFSWYQKAQSSLKGYVRLICCNNNHKPYSKSASVADATDLLEQVAILLTLDA